MVFCAWPPDEPYSVGTTLLLESKRSKIPWILEVTLFKRFFYSLFLNQVVKLITELLSEVIHYIVWMQLKMTISQQVRIIGGCYAC